MFVERKKCTQHLETFNLKAKRDNAVRTFKEKNTINNKHNIQKTWFITYCFIGNVLYYGSKCRDWSCPYWPAMPFKIKKKKKKKKNTHLTVIGNIARISHQKLMTFYCHKFQLYKNAGSFTLERLNLHLWIWSQCD